MRGYDAWVTREPPYMDYETPPPRQCSHCGRFLADACESKREYVVVRRCDGKAKVLTCEYDDGTHEEILRIIGEQHRGGSYQVAYPAACGSKDGKPNEHGDWLEADTEIGVAEAGEWTHAPHFYATPYDYVTVEIRTCKCGHANEDVQPL